MMLPWWMLPSGGPGAHGRPTKSWRRATQGGPMRQPSFNAFFFGGWGWVGRGLRFYFRKMFVADVVVEMTNASIKLELFQLVVTLRDGTISKGFGGASGRCRSAFQPLKLHRGEVLLWSVKCQILMNPAERATKKRFAVSHQFMKAWTFCDLFVKSFFG